MSDFSAPGMKGSVFTRMESIKTEATKKELVLIKKLSKIDSKSLIYLSITELSELTGVAEATIVRFCHKLDYQGYQDFKLHLSQDIALKGAAESKKKPDLIADEMVDAIRQTQRNVDYDNILTIAQKIIRARRICVFAVGNSSIAALSIKYSLSKVGLNVSGDLDPHIQSVVAANLTEQDIVILVSVSGSTKDIIEIAKIAKSHNVPVVVLTNHLKSPIIPYSTYRLYSVKKEAANNGGNIATIVSQNYMADVLCSTVIELMGESAKRNALRAHSAVSNKLL